MYQIWWGKNGPLFQRLPTQLWRGRKRRKLVATDPVIFDSLANSVAVVYKTSLFKNTRRHGFCKNTRRHTLWKNTRRTGSRNKWTAKSGFKTAFFVYLLQIPYLRVFFRDQLGFLPNKTNVRTSSRTSLDRTRQNLNWLNFLVHFGQQTVQTCCGQKAKSPC